MKKIAGLVILMGVTAAWCSAQTPTTTTILSSLNPSSYGQSVTFTATVTSKIGSPPDGEIVSFVQGTTTLGTAPLSGGSAAFMTSSLTGGTDSVKAEYPGDSTFESSKSRAVAEVVDMAPTSTTLSSSQNPAASGSTVIFTATVTGQVGSTAITGNVAFYNGSAKLGSATVSASGVATYKTAKLAVGTNSVTGVYNGSRAYGASTSNAVNEVVGVGQFIDTTMTFDGVTRYYEVYLPATMGANPPMLLMLHGTQSTTNPQAVISLNWGWQSVADAYGFILVKPASTYNTKSGQWNWNAYSMDAAFQAGEGGTCTEPPATGCPDDAGFLRQLITNLASQYNVNQNQIYVAGFSSGAQMAHRVAVEISDLVAAVVIGSGTIVGQLAPPPITMPGLPLEPISVQEWHGTADTEIPPCDHGTTGYSGVKFYLATVDDSFNYWTTNNACTTFANTQPLCKNDAPNTGTTGNDATACASGAEVQFIWEEGLGHAWTNSSDTVRWQFFAAHAKPE